MWLELREISNSRIYFEVHQLIGRKMNKIQKDDFANPTTEINLVCRTTYEKLRVITEVFVLKILTLHVFDPKLSMSYSD